MDKNKIFLIIVIVLLVVLIGAMVFLGLNVAKVVSGNKTEAETKTVQEEVPQLSTQQLDIVALEKPIVSNLKKGADKADHVMSTSVSVGVSKQDKKQSPVILAEVTGKQTVIRAICGELMRGKTFEELKKEGGLDLLEEEILSSLQAEFGSNLIYSVYLSDTYLE